MKSFIKIVSLLSFLVLWLPVLTAGFFIGCGYEIFCVAFKFGRTQWNEMVNMPLN